MGMSSGMRGGFVRNNFVLPTSTDVAARADVIAAAAAMPASSKARLAGGLVLRRGMSGALGTAVDTSSVGGFFSSITGWISANPLLAGAGAIGAFMLMRGGRRR